MKALWLALILATTVALAPGRIIAQEIRQERVHFTAGASSATATGSIKGYASVDYLLSAAAGQTMTVTLKTSNLSSYFNVLSPESETAIFIGSTSGNEWTDTLTATGDYTVRVYLMRNAARHGEQAKYTISFAVNGGSAGTATQETPR